LVKAGYNPDVVDMFEQPINGGTRYCAVYGFPVKHSASPPMQNAGIAALGLNWRYLAFEVHPESLRTAIEGAMRMNFIGLNLTVPHKLLALEMLDVVDASARAWGAVNTVRFEAKDGRGVWRPAGEFGEPPHEIRSHGFNTDADAIARSLREDLGVELAGAKILLLGAGGAGQTAALKLADEKVSELFLVNRTRSKADGLANEITARYPAVKTTVGYPAGTVDIVLNATSLGLKPNDSLPFDHAQFSLRQTGAVYDMVYRPAETELLKMAKVAGCRIANGLGMLLYQGATALELWSGQPAPIQMMRRALERNVYGEP
jgi:shikimate dehydrogenase